MSDKVFIRNLVLPCHIGVTEEERSEKQNVILDIEVTSDLRRAGATDDITQTTDYYEIKENVTGALAKAQFKLLEALAETVATIVLHDPAALAVTVSVKKEKYSESPAMGIEILRRRNG